MDLFPIILGVRLSSDAESFGSAPSEAQKNKTLERDNFSCRFCGFHSKKYQRVIAYAKAGDPPFATICTFCEQCLFLERAGITGSGKMIWLPEIEQAALNHIARAIYVARFENSPSAVSDLANRALEALLARRVEAKKRIGDSDPMILATVLHESLTAEERKNAIPKLEGLRLLPGDKHLMRGSKGDVNTFKDMVDYWRSPQGPFGKIPPEKWPELFKSATSAAGHA